MSASETLSVQTRQKLGSRASRALRYNGKIPATVQSSDGPHLDIALDRHAFLAARRHHVHLFDLDVDGNVESAVIRELQWDTFGEEIVHVEFRRVQRGVETETEVGLTFVGHPKSGVSNHVVTHLTIRSLPSLIPDEIEVKLNGLSEGDSLHAKDLTLPEGCSLGGDPDELVITVSGAVTEIEPAAEDEEEAGPLDGGEGTPPPPA